MIYKGRKTVIAFGGRLAFWCPGCEELHAVNVPGHTSSERGRDSWQWNGDYTDVTISPSLLTLGGKQGQDHRCHLFLRNGGLQFLGDCTHGLANQTVPLPDLPDWVLDSTAE